MKSLQKNSIFLTVTSVMLWLGLIVIRIVRVAYGIGTLGLNVESFADILFVFAAFLQDLFFVAVIYIIFCFLCRISQTIAILNAVFLILYAVLSEFIFITALLDYGYYTTCGHSATIVKLSVVGSNFFSLSDSFFACVHPILVAFAGLMIILIAVSGILSVIYFPRMGISGVFNPGLMSYAANPVAAGGVLLLYVFLCGFCHSVGIAKQNEIATQTLVRVVASLSERYEDTAGATEDTAPITAFRRFNRDSATQPLSLMDRQIIESVRANLPKSKKNYNIVLYLSESTFAGYYPMYNGNTANVGVSPFLESKTDNMLLMMNNYTTGVRSINSLISLLTGIGGYPGYKEIHTLDDTLNTPALSQILAPRGYKSALVHGGNFYFYNKLKFLNNRGFDYLADAAMLKTKYPQAMSNSWGIDDRLIIREGLAWIDKQISDGKPWTLTLVPIAPHHPYDVPNDIQRYIAAPKNDYEKYLNSLMYVDELFRMLWSGLEERGVLSDTIIVFTADHGEAFGQHKNNTGHENYIYQENVRTPCMIFNPELISGYNQIDTVTDLSDILPTILEILGEEVPVMCQGESILSRNTGKYSFFGCGERNVDIGMIDGHYKAVYDYINNKMSLYDLDKEMYDFTDISSQESRLTVAYKKILMQYYVYQKNFIENFNTLAEKAVLSSVPSDSVSLLDITPFFRSQDKYEIRKNADHEDKPIKILDKVYPVGYGVHANSNMQFNLKNLGFTRFTGLAGKLDVPSWRQNFLEMRIYVDGIQKFTTGKLTTDDPPVNFDIDIDGAEILQLMVLDGGDNTRYDRAAWIDPMLIRD